jgi:membrane-bound ClpP family serine protease
MDNTPLIGRRISLMGPVVLIVVGAMFLVAQFVPGWGIGKTWPALLIVIGILKLVDSSRPPRAPRGPRV